MSQQNNSNSEAGMAFALIGTMAVFFIAIIFAIGAFVSFCFTILCIFAWHDGLTLGKLTITREEARAFVWRGLLGAFLLPMFALFCAVLFDTPIRDDFWIYILIAGYAGGSVGVGMLLHSDEQQAASAMEVMPPQMIAPPPPIQRPQAQPQERPFRFASWDDEEERQ